MATKVFDVFIEGDKVATGTIVEFSNGKNYALKFIEQEITSIDERYWQFAVPVEDGE